MNNDAVTIKSQPPMKVAPASSAAAARIPEEEVEDARGRRLQQLRHDWRTLAREWQTLAETMEQFKQELEWLEENLNCRRPATRRRIPFVDTDGNRPDLSMTAPG